MATARVKWFNNQRGVGFISPDDGSEDLFVDRRFVSVRGLQELATDQAVEFRMMLGRLSLAPC